VAKHYREMLCEVMAGHPGSSYVFYLDVSLDEALRRHRMRPLGREVPSEEFRRWHVPNDLLSVTDEVVLDATADVHSITDAIVARLGGVEDKHRDVHRFL
jgi:hypothetical protein